MVAPNKESKTHAQGGEFQQRVGKEGLIIRSKCHPEVGLVIKYTTKSGKLQASCGECGRRIAEVKIKEIVLGNGEET